MARPLRIQYPGAYYHVTCRGNERKAIFRSDSDRKLFLAQLHRSLDIFNVTLLAYACMPNHFHLLVTTPEGNLSEFMRHFNLSYTAAFNRKYRRSGHLYQGRYKSFLVDADNYLLEVSRYIHLNPMRMKSDENLNQRWANLRESDQTSLPGYLIKKNRMPSVNYRIVLDYIGGDNPKGHKNYDRFLEEGVKHPPEHPLKSGMVPGIIGGEDFVCEIKKKLGLKGSLHREQPQTRQISKVFSPEAFITIFSRAVAKERDELLSRGKQSVERAMLMELLYRYCRMTQPEIGRLVGGIDYSAVSQSRKRFRLKMEKDEALRKRYQAVVDKISKGQS